MKGSFIRNTAAACALAFAAVGAQADIVTTWDYTITLKWVDWHFTSGGGSQTHNDTLISWGQSNGSHAVPGGTRSALEITDTPHTGVATTVETGDTLIFSPSGSITHYNNSLTGTHATLDTAKLNAHVVLTPKTPEAGSALEAFEYDFNIYFIETTNTAGNCLPEATSVCDDIFVISQEALNQTFDHDGQTYYVSITEASGSLTPLSNAACAAAGSSSPCLGFLTEENKKTTANLQFAITTDPVRIPVPEPGTLVLMGLGLVGLRSLRRRS